MMLELAGLGDTLAPWVTFVFGENGVALLKIIGIDILLSGDNAVVIALACRSLPADKRKIGIALGVFAAITLRVLFTVGLQSVLDWPWLMLVGGLMLLWIAVQLLIEADDDDKVIADSKTLWGAVATIALADVVMSLDNVLAIAGAAHGKPWLIFFGIALSIPLIMVGATLIINMLTRFPILVWAGAALLGWVAGDLIGSEKSLATVYAKIIADLGISPSMWPHLCAAVGALIVLAAGAFANSVRRTRAKAL
jgi:YjbE family integral membrane protein